MIHSFLMLGQSNMAGRGELGEVPEISNEKIWMLRNGRWQPMHEPINPDRPSAGVGLAASFAEEYVKALDSTIGLIPCADGGTTLDDWAVGSQLYNHAVFQAKLAQRISKIGGILWHQGESDSTSIDAANAYEDKFKVIISSIVENLCICDVPVILGELGEFIGDYKDCEYKFFNKVNKSLIHISQTMQNFAIASARGLKSKSDGIHFNSSSCRELGRRYFAEYYKLCYESKT